MMVTDDTFQDEQQVLAAKALLYREHLPEHIKKVHLVSDGAGCYKSKLHRTIMLCWESWTGIVELTYRITPAGDGKSVLDGMFARMNNCLATAVNEGGSHYDAETTIEMAEMAGGGWLLLSLFSLPLIDQQKLLSKIFQLSQSFSQFFIQKTASLLLTIIAPTEMEER